MSINKYYTTLTLILSLACFSQSHSDLYIIYTKESGFLKKSIEQTSGLELRNYFSQFKTRPFPMKLSLDEHGVLFKQITVRGSREHTLGFRYQNSDFKNNPILVAEDQIINSLTSTQLSEQIEESDYNAIIKNFKNIYVIEEGEMIGRYKIARKVEQFEVGGL